MKKYKSKSALKHFIVTAIFAAMCQHGAAQTAEDFATGLNDPRGIHTIGANLYVAESGGNIISKINLDTKVKTAQFTGTVDNFTNIRGLTSKGNDLYIAISGLSSISKIDVSGASALVDVLTSVDDLGTVESIVLDENSLYATARNLSKIVKIENVTIPSPVVDDFITGIMTPRALLLSGTDLYVTSGSAGGKLSKINLTDASPVAVDVLTGLNSPSHMALDGNILYISEVGTRKVIKTDISMTTLVKTDVTMELTAPPQGLAIHNDYLYVAQAGDVDKIVRYLVFSSIRPGSFTITMQGQIDDINSKIVGIEDDLIIKGTTTGTITSLAGLENITSVGGNLQILGNISLTSLEGLNDLVTLGGKLQIGTDGTNADANANTTLVNFCAISNLVTGTGTGTSAVPAQITRTGVTATNEYFVANNGYNPTYVQLGSAVTCTNTMVASTNTFSKEEDYRLFPNPVKDILFVKSESEITSISISNVSGQAVLKGNSGSINVQYLSKGIYFAKIVSGEKVTVEKFIKM